MTDYHLYFLKKLTIDLKMNFSLKLNVSFAQAQIFCSFLLIMMSILFLWYCGNNDRHLLYMELVTLFGLIT